MGAWGGGVLWSWTGQEQSSRPEILEETLEKRQAWREMVRQCLWSGKSEGVAGGSRGGGARGSKEVRGSRWGRPHGAPAMRTEACGRGTKMWAA